MHPKGLQKRKMTIKELLASHKETDDRINCMLEEVAQLRALAERSTMRMTGESRAKGGHSDKVGTNAAKIADLEIKIDREIDELVDLKERIHELVNRLADPTERTVTERHYILHESWEKTAEVLRYTPRHVQRIHNKALEHLESMYVTPLSA